MTLPQAAAVAPKANRKARRRAEKQARKQTTARGKQAPAVGPQSSAAIALLQQALPLHRASKLQAAEELYRQVLAIEPNNANALRLLGTILHHGGQTSEGIALLEQAARVAPGVPDIWNNLGVARAACGQDEEAIRHYEKAISLRPDYGDAHRNLGTLQFRRDDYQAAIKHLEKARAANSTDVKLLLLLAIARSQSGELESAVRLLRTVLERDPDNLVAHESLALALIELKQPEAALDQLVRAIPAHPRSKALQLLLKRVLEAAPPRLYRPDLEQSLITCFNASFLYHRSIARFAADQIRLKYQAQRSDEFITDDDPTTGRRSLRVHLDGILGDELLIRMLESVVNVDVPLEFFLTPLRRSLLFSARNQPQISPQAMRFMAALALQCCHNGYIFWTDEAETGEVRALDEEIAREWAARGKPSAALETKLALYGMYRPLGSLSIRTELGAVDADAWSEELRPVVRAMLYDPMEEAAIKESLPAFGAIEDETSRAVRSQYEENPYPRWFNLPQQGRISLAEYLEQQIPGFAPSNIFAHEAEMLVAGSGTGQHPLSLAEMLSNVAVVAVDLSRASLAYAQRMARRCGVENIAFMQGDILQISALGRRFPVIECSGVLHHMLEPDAGLAALTAVLMPGGLMKLGLYSELARQWVVTARARIAELNLEPTAENIRGFRRAIILGQEVPGCDLSRFSDFHDLDSFRDLVFHVQEHRYTIPALRDFLARQDLQFLGFSSTDDRVLANFGDVHPNADERDLHDLDRWQQVEETHPSTFLSMYQFWCRKPD